MDHSKLKGENADQSLVKKAILVLSKVQNLARIIQRVIINQKEYMMQAVLVSDISGVSIKYLQRILLFLDCEDRDTISANLTKYAHKTIYDFMVLIMSVVNMVHLQIQSYKF